MTTVNNTFNFNINFQQNNLGGSSFGGMLAAGIFGSFAQPLGAGPFASAKLPSLFSFQGCQCPPQRGNDTPAYQPVDDAKWTASVEGSTGEIDLGDGYTLQLDERNSEITIHNAETGETTRVWGDPHVDIDGKHAFDFWGKTTFQLENGTKITIDTEQAKSNPDEYFASKLTITKGSQAIEVNGISQNEIGDLSVTQSSNGYQLDARTGDGFVLNENDAGSGWRSGLTGEIATQEDLNATKPGQAYGPGTEHPDFSQISDLLSSFLLMGALSSLFNATFEAANGYR